MLYINLKLIINQVSIRFLIVDIDEFSGHGSAAKLKELAAQLPSTKVDGTQNAAKRQGASLMNKITVIIIAITMTVLCGCPQSGELKCWLLYTDENGVQNAYPVSNFSGIDAPYGAYLHFEGGRVNVTKSWVDYQVVGRDKPLRLNLVNPNDKAEDGAEKCSAICATHVVVGLVAIAGYTAPAIADAVANTREQWFDIVVPMGPAVETATLKVVTTDGDQFIAVLYGEAYDYKPPADDTYRLTVKVQGKGSVVIDGVNQEVTTSAVFDVDADTDVYFTAKPASGWRFEKWLVNGSSEGTTPNIEAKVTMKSDVELIAVFVAESAPPNPSTPIVGTLSWNGSQLTASFTGVTSSVFGFEIYQISGSAPWVEREVWNVSNGVASGTVTKFRYNLNKTFRFENVTTAAAGDGYVDPAKVSWTGSYIPTRITDVNGNVAWQITFP